MEMTQAIDLTRDALFVSLLIAGPILVAGLVVGIIISLLQTVTQLQDQTLSIVPKIVAMVAAAVFFIPWLGMRMVEYAGNLFAGV